MPTPPPTLRDRIASVSASLSPAQLRVARLVDESPDLVAFGTVAEVAAASDTSPPTVLRLAGRLGHSGFPDLQAQVRAELVARLPPAADRIRRPPGADLPGEIAAIDAHNVATSLDVDPPTLAAVAEALAGARHVGVLAAESWAGIGRLLVDQLGQLRSGVESIDGPAPRIARLLAPLGADDVLVAIDTQRYERWVLDAADQAARAGVPVVGISDGPTSPLLGRAAHRLVVGVASPSPFDSPTGVVALLHLVVAEVATRLRDAARDRLDGTESAWSAAGAFVPDDR